MEAAQLPSSPLSPDPPGDAFTPSGKFAAMLLGSLALLIVLFIGGAPLFVLALPLLIVGTMASIARPAATVFAVLILSGFIGTIIAFVGIPVDAMAAGILLCLWVAVAGSYLFEESRRPLWLWPALIPLVLYVVISIVQMLTSESLPYAFADFRITVWYMLAVVLLAVAPWSSLTFRRIALGFALVTLAVGLYTLYRYIFGESAEEFAQARGAVQRVAFSVPVRFFGSFLSAFQLAAWCAVAFPMLLALAFVTKRWWRLVSIVALGLCAFAVFASDVRTGLVAAVAGAAFVMGLFIASRAFAVQRIAATFFAVIGIAAVGVIGYELVIAGNEVRSDRFERILNPESDFAWQERLTRWDAALEVVDDEPLGHGLGTQGYVGQSQNPKGQVGPFNLDSTYLKVGIQQGYLVMLLFAAAQVALLAGIATRSVRVRDPWRCALGIGACGTLVAQMILFFNGIYSEGVTSLAAWLLIGLGAAQFTSSARLGDDGEQRPAAQ